MSIAGPIMQERAAFERIHASHHLDSDVNRLLHFYGDWAASYDLDVKREHYCGPTIVAELAGAMQSAYLDSDRATIQVLDAGCGTGLTGIELRRLGFELIDGFDLSEDMARRARELGVYRQVSSGVDMNKPLPTTADNEYDVTVCCGVFTLGHVLPSGLTELVGVTRPGGILIVSTRKSYFERTSFEENMRNLRDTGQITLIQCLYDGNYIKEEGAHYWVFQMPFKS